MDLTLLPDWILIEKSINELEVDFDKLKKGSHVKVFRECITCKQFKLLEFRQAIKYQQCKPCQNKKSKYSSEEEKNKFYAQKQRITKEKFKNYINEYLKCNPCIDCGNSDIEVLSFDHIAELGEKKFNIDDLNGSPAHYKRFDEEVLKCVIRCINCHMAIEKERTKNRLYCFLNNIPFVEKSYTRRSVKISDKRFASFQKFARKKRNKYYETNLENFVKIISSGCFDCKGYFPLSMEFDHLPQYEKENKISDLFFCWQRPWEEVLKEMSKCDLVCANCHRKRTNNRLKEGWN